MAIKRSKYTESQVVFAIKQAETGTPVAEVCRKMGISEIAHARAHRLDRMEPQTPHQSWSMDFVADQLFDGRRFRALTVVDNFSR